MWLKLQPYKQSSVHKKLNQKLSSKYFGPYQVVAKIGSVAYKIRLPESAQIHDVFHVSQLKAFHVTLQVTAHIPEWMQHTSPNHTRVPVAILEMRVVKFQDKV